MGCKYRYCSNAATAESGFCVYHAPPDEKGMTIDEFNAEMDRRLIDGHFNMAGFIFPGDTDLTGRSLGPKLMLKGAVFHGRLEIDGLVFDSGADFRGAKFYDGISLAQTAFGGRADFRDVQFMTKSAGSVESRIALLGDNAEFRDGIDLSGAAIQDGYVLFRNCQFLGSVSTFSRCEMIDCTVQFSRSRFKDIGLDFRLARFKNVEFDLSDCEIDCTFVRFDGTDFSGGSVAMRDSRFNVATTSYVKTRFCSDRTSFRNSRFSGRLAFVETAFSGEIRFDGVQFSPDATFDLEAPRFDCDKDSGTRLIFTRVRFNPFLTYFKQVGDLESMSRLSFDERPQFVFRYCHLKDVYFLESVMSLVSFYRSATFEEARFSSCVWLDATDKLFGLLRFRRRYLALEDIKLGKVPDLRERTLNQTSDEAELYPKDESDVAEIYLRLKAAADRAKDYHLGSWFYFNEFEMKRLAAKNSYSSAKRGFIMRMLRFRSWAYSLYRVLAGYGEKPMWSMLWFVAFTTVFVVTRLFSGFQYEVSPDKWETINYDIVFPWHSSGEAASFWALVADVWHAIRLTVSTIVPSYYLSSSRLGVRAPQGAESEPVLSIVMSAVLILLIVFTAIGLKRHFRRF